MPLDSTIPQETGIAARQVGGKSLAADSPLWKTLFPSPNLRIDGRVPVEGSAKYLLQMRMNAAKELFSVAFTPSSDASESGFKALSDFLTAKRYYLHYLIQQSITDCFIVSQPPWLNLSLG